MCAVNIDRRYVSVAIVVVAILLDVVRVVADVFVDVVSLLLLSVVVAVVGVTLFNVDLVAAICVLLFT